MARSFALALPNDPVAVQLENKAAWNKRRSARRADFFTIGYMRRGIGEFIETLKKAGAVSVIDIRHNPVSMYKPEFSKNNLRCALEEASFNYFHIPEFGVPRDVRGKAIGKPNRDAIWEWYDRYVVERLVGRNLNWFLNLADHPIALMCVEVDPTACHRHRLSVALERHRLRSFDL